MSHLQMKVKQFVSRLLSPFSDLPYLPQWVILFIETGLSVIAFTLSYLICYELIDMPVITDAFLLKIGLCIVVNVLSFRIFRTYTGIIRYSTFRDALRLIFALVCSNVTLLIVSQYLKYNHSTFIFLRVGFVINFVVSFMLIFLFRMLVRVIYDYIRTGILPQGQTIPLFIYGVSASNVEIGKLLNKDSSRHYKLVGFIASSRDAAHKKLIGVPVYSDREQYMELLEEYDNPCLLINPQELDYKTKESLSNLCLDKGIRMISPPPVSSWGDSVVKVGEMKDIQIEDLLGRMPIEIDTASIASSLSGRSILVTGAAGSIGSELVRQISRFGPGRILLCDIAESPLHNLRLELSEAYPEQEFVFLVSDVRNYDRMNQVFRDYRPDYVYHAAAYKHVPLMEEFPEEAVRTNVLGSRNIADLSNVYGAKSFVMVSTDKAVNPSNVMGTSKRIAEIYVQSLALSGKSSTRYITTRFGNVLGSNGSVIPLFKHQIAKGGPVTVTHRDIIRYFMTIPEACRLVLEAGNMGKGGEIFVFDMGEPVRITDLAERMIRLAGFAPYRDIEIRFTGLRPGEKLYEELLNDKETTIATHNPKIMIGTTRRYDYSWVVGEIECLVSLAGEGNGMSIVSQMKRIVPEFLSANSQYAELDNKGKEEQEDNETG